MPLFLRSILAVCALALLSLAGNASAEIVETLKSVVSTESLDQRDWIEVRSPNFQVHSVQNEKLTLRLARHLEDLRAGLGAFLNTNLDDSPIPLEIYLLSNDGQFKQLGIDPTFSSVFIPGLRRNVIVMRDTNGYVPETEIIAWEYASYILSTTGGANYPQWFVDGFAAFFSTARKRSGEFEFGNPQEHLVRHLAHWHWVPLRKILIRANYEERKVRHSGLMVGEAWALVHFLFYGRDGRSIQEDLAEYVEQANSGTDQLAAFESAFGITANELDKQVKGYLKSSSQTKNLAIRRVAAEFTPDLSPEVHSVSRHEISLALGRIALSMRKLDSAQDWFLIALDDERTRPQAEAGLGNVYRLSGHLNAASDHVQKAIAHAPEDPYCALDAGQYWHYRAQLAGDLNERATFLNRAREHYVRAWKQDESKPEPYVLYGQTFLTEGEGYRKAIEVLKVAESIVPSNLTVRAMLAQAYLGANQMDKAVDYARSVSVWGHDSSNAVKLARNILAGAGPTARSSN